MSYEPPACGEEQPAEHQPGDRRQYDDMLNRMLTDTERAPGDVAARRAEIDASRIELLEAAMVRATAERDAARTDLAFARDLICELSRRPPVPALPTPAPFPARALRTFKAPEI